MRNYVLTLIQVLKFKLKLGKKMDKHKRFKMALLKADKTQREFAKENGVTEHAILFFLKGRFDSKRLSKAIDDFISKNVPELLEAA